MGGDPGPRPAARFPRLDGSSSSGRSAVITELTLLLIVDVRGAAFYTAWTLIGLALVSEGAATMVALAGLTPRPRHVTRARSGLSKCTTAAQSASRRRARMGPTSERVQGCYGADMWLDTNPYEVGMGYDWMVDLEQKADFIGKQALARIKQEGVARKLAGVEIAGASLGAYNDGSMIDVFPVSRRGERVGKVTSACHSPRLRKNIGYAMVPVELAELGTELEVDVGGDRRDAVVVEMPFIDPKKEIPKQRLVTGQ
jgi:hypothetical protein